MNSFKCGFMLLALGMSIGSFVCYAAEEKGAAAAQQAQAEIKFISGIASYLGYADENALFKALYPPDLQARLKETPHGELSAADFATYERHWYTYEINRQREQAAEKGPRWMRGE